MQVKIIKDGIESEWFELTKAHHRTLLGDMPEAAIIKIEDLYPGSPDKDELVKLDFNIFTALVRDFILEENRQNRRTMRHHDKRPLEGIKVNDFQTKITTMEDIHLHSELLHQLTSAKQILTPIQLRRLKLYIEDNLSLREIATLEGVHNTTIEDSIRAALKKFKKFLD